LLEFLTVAGTFFAGYAVLLAKDQIKAAEVALWAGTQYQISKDHDELVASIPPAVWTRLQATEPGPALDTEAERHVLRILSFASSVLEQKDLGLVTPKFWESFRRNFCGFLRMPAVSAYWEAKIATGQLEFSDELTSLKRECRK
jgi:hypothetical protein